MKKMFYAKVILGLLVLFSFLAFLFFPTNSNLNESLVKNNNLLESIGFNTKHKIEKTYTNNTSEEATKIHAEKNLFSDQVLVNNKARMHFTAVNWKEESRFINSESFTTYKAISQTEKEIQQKLNQARINSAYDEYAPVINKNGSFMFFTSRRPVTSKEIRKGQGRERIYYTESGEKGWTKAVLLESPINSDQNFNSAVALSNDGKSLFIYRDDRNGNGDLFESRLLGSKWSTPEPLPSPINSTFHESSLSLSADGNTLYFTSNRTGGSGGMDIWYTQKNKAGIWGTAKNLGSEINTNKDEEGVFIHSDGKTLYFSSKGHKGMGGYDIYETTLENGVWSKPVNLGPEINTSNDDLYFILEEDGSDAYYTSINPNAPKKKDIFKINYKPDFNKKSNQEKYTLLTGTVVEKNNLSPIKAQIEIYNSDNNTLLAKIESDSKTGDFFIQLPQGNNYSMHVYKEKYLYYTEKISTNSKENKQLMQKKILLDELQSNTRFVFKELSIKENKNIFDLELQVALDELLAMIFLNSDLKIQLILETGNVKEFGAKKQQILLDECLNYLESKGINKARATGKIVVKEQHKKQSATLLVNISSI
ncbi:MAG: hypothetical protein PHQ74_03630 [Crocinitomicaceae bacterium]|nr:hypothetical protein [Crocinitomicaceae bacterium]